MNPGRLKFIIDRVTWYPSKLQTIISIITLMGVYGLPLWWLLVLSPALVLAFVLVWRFDKRRVLKSEWSTWSQNTPEMVEILQILRRLDEKRD
jgi:ABC-type bacteriocin/lantibiotic exporter with double-glycine peptidase domain